MSKHYCCDPKCPGLPYKASERNHPCDSTKENGPMPDDEPKKIVFDVDFPGEMDAGLWPFTDRITVLVDSRDPGGDPGEFEEHIRQSLVEWYDGAHVELVDTNARFAIEHIAGTWWNGDCWGPKESRSIFQGVDSFPCLLEDLELDAEGFNPVNWWYFNEEYEPHAFIRRVED